MTPLAFPFTRDRFRHDLLDRSGMVCLVQRTNLAVTPHSTHWEVVVLHLARPYGAPAGTPPDHEAYPPSSAWGTDGFTYTSLPEAQTRFADLVHAHDEKGRI